MYTISLGSLCSLVSSALLVFLQPDDKKTGVETTQWRVEIFQALQQEPGNLCFSSIQRFSKAVIPQFSKVFIIQSPGFWRSSQTMNKVSLTPLFILLSNNRRPLSLNSWQLSWMLVELLYKRERAENHNFFQCSFDIKIFFGHQDCRNWWHLLWLIASLVDFRRRQKLNSATIQVLLGHCQQQFDIVYHCQSSLQKMAFCADKRTFFFLFSSSSLMIKLTSICLFQHCCCRQTRGRGWRCNERSHFSWFLSTVPGCLRAWDPCGTSALCASSSNSSESSFSQIISCYASMLAMASWEV